MALADFLDRNFAAKFAAKFDPNAPYGLSSVLALLGSTSTRVGFSVCLPFLPIHQRVIEFVNLRTLFPAQLILHYGCQASFSSVQDPTFSEYVLEILKLCFIVRTVITCNVPVPTILVFKCYVMDQEERIHANSYVRVLA